MRRIQLFFMLLAVCSVVPVPMLANSPDRAVSANAEVRQEFPTVVELTQRVVPWLVPDLLTRRIPRDQGRDVFEISTQGDKLIVAASDVPSAAEGLNWYLKYYCHRSISHLGNNVAPLAPLPQIPQPMRRTARFGTRYYLNYCTFNYTFSFADWRSWERELDWMALNGVNLALATIGTEAVWQNTLRQIGYSDSEFLDFLPGPAYTAWWLMGNLEGWGGPVTQRIIEERLDLQRKILARMRELGIEPIFQGFYGMVPASLAQKFPRAKIVDQGTWGGFHRPPVLLSTDPLFARLASIYYGELRKLYGAVRYFGGDLFQEGGVTAGLDVTAIASGVQQAMRLANSQAVWVLQGWEGNPIDALLNGLSREHTLVLDVDSTSWEQRKGYDGMPWVWAIVNNFGENTGMFGNLPQIISEPIRAANGPYGQNLVGIGAMMEGINNNPVVYDLLFEMAWQNEPVDVRQWVHGYAEYRYGMTTPQLNAAWQILAETIYASSSTPQSIFCARPPVQVQVPSSWGGGIALSYDPAKIEEAARDFLSAEERLGGVDTYQVDAVELVRQVLSNRGLSAYGQMETAYQAHDKPGFDQSSNQFLDLLRDEDRLLATRHEFLLGNWLQAAKEMGKNQLGRTICERNARTQITYWGPDDPSTELHDYAHKEWSGLLRDFYLPRWQMFVQEFSAQLDGKPAELPNYFEFEKGWTEQRKSYPTEPTGDPIATAATMLSGTPADAEKETLHFLP